jgi:hypothetical protein
MPNRRRTNAAMSPIEVNALRRVDSGLTVLIAAQHRDLLIRMELVRRSALGRLELTETGKQRLAADAKLLDRT